MHKHTMTLGVGLDTWKKNYIIKETVDVQVGCMYIFLRNVYEGNK